MSRSRIFLRAVAFAMCAVVCGSRLGAQTLENTQELGAFIDGLMFGYLREGKIPSAVVAIVKDGRTIFAKGYGSEDLSRGTPVDPAASTFRIGSTSKLFTWTAVMQLVEQGKLDLDADVNRYLKGLQIPNAYGAPVTLRSLMTHTAGFEEGSLLYLTGHDPNAQLSIQETLTRHIPQRVRPPLTLPAYSNYGAALAGLIVEQVSGIPFNDYIRRNILEPLGMRHTTFAEPLPPELIPHQVIAYLPKNGDYERQLFEIIGGFRPAGSASATALDMTRFMLAHLQDGEYDGVRILKPETAARMHSSAFQLDRRLPGMDLGFYESNANGLRIIGHAGDTDYFHTNLALVPAKQIGLFISYVGSESTIRRALLKALLDRYYPATQVDLPMSPAASTRSLQKYAGSYLPARRNFSGIYKLLDLGSQKTVSVAPNGRLIVDGLGAGRSQYIPIGTDLFRESGGDRRIAFSEGPDGVMRLLVDAAPPNPFERTRWTESVSLWLTLLTLSVLVVLACPVPIYRIRRAFPAGHVPHRWVIWLALSVGACALAMCVIAVVIAAGDLDSTVDGVPAALKGALLLPMLFVALTLMLIAATVKVWVGRSWALRQRIVLTLHCAGALMLSVFFYQWNVLGWQFG